MANADTARELGLLEGEYEKIVELLGRNPNFTELSAFSVMWSEHCCYKNSILWLKKLPKHSDKMLAEAGEENAGLVDIGDGLACAFKIESHNHPSALEPYQGAATGVGGINRDIFTMGARPIAQLNTLRFGDLSLDRTKYLLKGVVKGIGDYGNAFGVPTVGGEVFFDESYNTNPLVNAFSAGIVETDKVASAISYGVGNPVFIVGSSTGKDGIHGAAFASKDITEDSIDDLPSVQVGDPFQEKLLLEATLEVIATGHTIGVQDMGAAGIICSTSEMSAKGEHGMAIDLDKVPLRQENMLPFEILLSESQERMLVVVKKGKEKEITDIFEKWDLNCVQIGEVTDTKRVVFSHKGEVVADIPANALVLGGDAPIYEREYIEPAYYQEYKKFKIEDVAEPNTSAQKEIAKFLLSHLNIASKKWVYEQYDSMVGTGTATTNQPSDAAVVWVKGTEKAIVVTVDCNARYVKADPEVGAMIAVCESARNVVCAGGNPTAITNNLNFGNPYNPEVYWQFVGSVKGMIKACEKLKTPVTGGNVSFYNQASTVNKDGGNVSNAVLPTPTIGMLGLMDNIKQRMTLNFKNEGDIIYMIGSPKNDISSSEYLKSYQKIEASPAPYFNLEEEYELQYTLKNLIKTEQVISMHDISEGGLFVALTESAMPHDLGFDISTEQFENIRKDALLFGESQSRVIISIEPDEETVFRNFMDTAQIDIYRLGAVHQDSFIIDNEVFMTVQEAKDLYENVLENMLKQ